MLAQHTPGPRAPAVIIGYYRNPHGKGALILDAANGSTRLGTSLHGPWHVVESFTLDERDRVELRNAIAPGHRELLAACEALMDELNLHFCTTDGARIGGAPFTPSDAALAAVIDAVMKARLP